MDETDTWIEEDHTYNARATAYYCATYGTHPTNFPADHCAKETRLLRTFAPWTISDPITTLAPATTITTPSVGLYFP